MFSWKEYWAGLAASYGWSDAEGLSAVLHPEAPAWFNSLIDRLQESAWRQGIQLCELNGNAAVLDVGCGTGRWLRRYVGRNLAPTGVDATEGMLQTARASGLTCPLLVGLAQSLPFKNQAFDLVSAVTVVQHIPPQEQREALNEMGRVLRPGGHLLLIELIRGRGPHIFPRQPADWISEASSAGLSLVAWRGQEFLFLDRAFVNVVYTLRRIFKNNSEPSLPGRVDESTGTKGANAAARSVYWAIRRLTCGLSEWLEPAVQKVCPGDWATHALFVFQKLH